MEQLELFPLSEWTIKKIPLEADVAEPYYLVLAYEVGVPMLQFGKHIYRHQAVLE